MSHDESVSESPVSTRDHPAEAATLDTDFEARWAAWQARGVAHDRAVRRKLVMLAAAIAILAAVLYGLWLL